MIRHLRAVVTLHGNNVSKDPFIVTFVRSTNSLARKLIQSSDNLTKASLQFGLLTKQNTDGHLWTESIAQRLSSHCQAP